MAITQTHQLASQKPLRLWPGVVIVILQWLVRFVYPVIVSGGMAVGMIGGVVGGLAVVVWWMFFSRAPWSERLGAVALIIVALFATSRIVHESIQNGMMVMMLFISSIPFLSLALVAGAAASRRLSAGRRRAVIVAAILLASGGWTLLRTGGITGDGGSGAPFLIDRDGSTFMGNKINAARATRAIFGDAGTSIFKSNTVFNFSLAVSVDRTNFWIFRAPDDCVCDFGAGSASELE